MGGQRCTSTTSHENRNMSTAANRSATVAFRGGPGSSTSTRASCRSSGASGSVGGRMDTEPAMEDGSRAAHPGGRSFWSTVSIGAFIITAAADAAPSAELHSGVVASLPVSVRGISAGLLESCTMIVCTHAQPVSSVGVAVCYPQLGQPVAVHCMCP